MEQQILWCFPRVWRADISVLSQVRILYVNEKEKRYKWNIMFLFAGHSDKPLKSLISIAHKENNICLYRFSFIYAVNDLWEDAYTCPIYAVNRTTESANLRYGMSAYIGFCCSYSGLTDFIDTIPRLLYTKPTSKSQTNNSYDYETFVIVIILTTFLSADPKPDIWLRVWSF